MRRSRELAELLLRKAAQDEYAFRRLWEDPQVPREIALFHAQQAVEKALKGLLDARLGTHPKSHSLEHPPS